MNDFKRVSSEVRYKLDMCKFSNKNMFDLGYSLIALSVYDETSNPEKNFDFNKIFESLGHLASLKEEIFIKNN